MLCCNIKGGATDGCTRPLSLQVTERCGNKSRILSACAPCRNILYLTHRHRAEHRRCERKTVRASAYIYGNRSNRPRWWWWLRRWRRRRGIKGCDSVFGEKLSRTTWRSDHHRHHLQPRHYLPPIRTPPSSPPPHAAVRPHTVVNGRAGQRASGQRGIYIHIEAGWSAKGRKWSKQRAGRVGRRGTAFPPRAFRTALDAHTRARAQTLYLYTHFSPRPRHRHRPMSEREHACARPRPSARDYSNTTYTLRAPPPAATAPRASRVAFASGELVLLPSLWSATTASGWHPPPPRRLSRPSSARHSICIRNMYII